MVTSSSPFGKYAAIVAAIAALAVLASWLMTNIGIAGMVPSPQLDAAALIVLGAIFGTGAGALVMANGLGRQVQAANTRLDAIHAPPAGASEPPLGPTP